MDDVVTHYTLSHNPHNKAIIDVKNKRAGDLAFMKIRYKLADIYAVSIIDPGASMYIRYYCASAATESNPM